MREMRSAGGGPGKSVFKSLLLGSFQVAAFSVSVRETGP